MGIARREAQPQPADADLVVWNGPPLEDTSGAVLVLVDGKPVLDPNRWFTDGGS